MTPPPPREPIFNIPWSVLALVALLAAIQAARDLLPDAADADLLARFAFVPGRLTYVFDPAAVLAGWSTGVPDRQEVLVAQFFLGDGTAQPWTALTYAGLHGGWTHLGLNAVWLLAFGTPLARRIGTPRFLSFMVAGAVAGAAAHYAVGPLSLQPLVGASASVSACMAAALRFMFRPAGEGGVGADRVAPERRPRLPLRAMLRDRRALGFFAVWFLTNLVTGVGAVPLGLSEAPIAWQAHIGGFLLGLLALPLFDRPAPPRAPAPSEGSPVPVAD